MLAELTRNYVKAINEGGVPTISTAWENVVQREAQRALSIASNHYRERVKEHLHEVVEQEEFHSLHENAQASAIALFRKKCVGSTPQHIQFEDDLYKLTETTYKSFQDDNYKKSTEKCQRIMRNLLQELHQSISSGSIQTYDQLEVAWDTTRKQYDSSASGPARESVKSNSLEKVSLDICKQIHDSLLKQMRDEFNTELRQRDERANQEYQRLEGIYREQEQDKKRSEERVLEIEDLRKSLSGIEEAKKDLIKDVIKLREKLETQPASSPGCELALTKPSALSSIRAALVWVIPGFGGVSNPPPPPITQPNHPTTQVPTRPNGQTSKRSHA